MYAKGLILCHTHPAGSTQASDADRAVTERIAAAATPLDMRVLDHFIVAGDSVVSFRQQGWM